MRVLVAEDSATARALLVSLLTAEPDMVVVGEAHTGLEAVEMAERLQPDLVTMDIQMPHLDGIEATRRIMTQSPRPILIVSSTAGHDVEQSLEAMRSGALMVIAKPGGAGTPTHDIDRRQLTTMVRALAQVKVVRRHGSFAQGIMPARATSALAGAEAARRLRGDTTPELVAIAASTGGPAALQAILSTLPARFPVPIFIVQHIARGFTAGLAHWLSGDAAVRVKLAELGEPARPGTVYIAPDDRHLGVRRDASGGLRVQLDNAIPVGTFRPSATYMFRSCAEHVGRGLIAVILTGMGDDGVEGLRSVKQSGGRILAQDEASSVIYGMPREAQRAGIVDQVLGITEMARCIRELAG
ncbi:MAG: chemotaxis-specific protein-glutamate methyltransferase CheB [Gemmatimonadaceae bacterium]|nr:chemotaxis-specific protein-glutamate methyltransferase CheB [Gemmatimonadaceae bacterium]